MCNINVDDMVCTVFCWKVNHLRVVLEKKRDPVTQVSLIDTIKQVSVYPYPTVQCGALLEIKLLFVCCKYVCA